MLSVGFELGAAASDTINNNNKLVNHTSVFQQLGQKRGTLQILGQPDDIVQLLHFPLVITLGHILAQPVHLTRFNELVVLESAVDQLIFLYYALLSAILLHLHLG